MDVKPVSLLGLPVHPVTPDQALEAVEGFIASGEPHLIVTADASAIILARRDKEFREIFGRASLVTADGAGVVLALKLHGTRLPERCCGVDLVVSISEAASKKGWSVFLLGAAPGVAEDAAEELKRRFPGLKVVGVHDGYFKEDEPVVSQISTSGADILFVAMGMPRQEKWFWEHRGRLGVKVAMGVGGTFDVLSGKVQRAPLFYQKHGLEWAYRMATNPRNRRKMALLPAFALLALAEAARRKMKMGR